MTMQRRTFLRGTLAGSAIGVAVGAGLLTPQAVLGAWPKKAFEAKKVGDALDALFGSSDAAASGDIKIKAPDIAENGAVVPITVSCCGISAGNWMPGPRLATPLTLDSVTCCQRWPVARRSLPPHSRCQARHRQRPLTFSGPLPATIYWVGPWKPHLRPTSTWR